MYRSEILHHIADLRWRTTARGREALSHMQALRRLIGDGVEAESEGGA